MPLIGGDNVRLQSESFEDMAQDWPTNQTLQPLNSPAQQGPQRLWIGQSKDIAASHVVTGRWDTL